MDEPTPFTPSLPHQMKERLWKALQQPRTENEVELLDQNPDHVFDFSQRVRLVVAVVTVEGGEILWVSAYPAAPGACPTFSFALALWLFRQLTGSTAVPVWKEVTDTAVRMRFSEIKEKWKVEPAAPEPEKPKRLAPPAPPPPTTDEVNKLLADAGPS